MRIVVVPESRVLGAASELMTAEVQEVHRGGGRSLDAQDAIRKISR